MAYAPISDESWRAPVEANATAWTTLVVNDVELWDGYEPGFECGMYPTARTAAQAFRFKVRGGDELISGGSAGMTLSIGLRASYAGASKVWTVSDGFSTFSGAAITSDAWYTTSVDPEMDYVPDGQDIVVALAADASATTITGLRCLYEAGSSSGIYYTSGWRLTPSFWATADRPVPSEVVSRLRKNPSALARSRPVCVAFHCCDTERAVTTKSTDLWGIADEVLHNLVGRLRVPYVDRTEREYIVDCYTTETMPDIQTTTIGASSNGATLPQATIYVADTTGFASSSKVAITTADGVVNEITYTGKTATTLTGCSGGTSVMTTGDAVRQGRAEYSIRIGGQAETWTGAGWHTWRVKLPAGVEHDIAVTINPSMGNAAAVRTLQVWRAS